MYIRRKVFSTFVDEYGQERYFSTTEFINEDTYLEEGMFSSAIEIDGKLLDGANTGKRSQAYYNEVGKEWANDPANMKGINRGNAQAASIRRAELKRAGLTEAEINRAMGVKDSRGIANSTKKAEQAIKKGGKAGKGLINRAVAAVKRNPKTAAAVAVGTAGVGAGAVYAANRK